MANLKKWMLALRQRRANLLGTAIQMEPDKSELVQPIRQPQPGYKLSLSDSKVVEIPMSLDSGLGEDVGANVYQNVCKGTSLKLHPERGYYTDLS